MRWTVLVEPLATNSYRATGTLPGKHGNYLFPPASTRLEWAPVCLPTESVSRKGP